MFASEQQGIAGFDPEKFPGFLGDHDLSPVTDSCSTEYPLLFVFAEDVFASGHFITSFIFFILFTPVNYNENRSGCQYRSRKLVATIAALAK